MLKAKYKVGDILVNKMGATSKIEIITVLDILYEGHPQKYVCKITSRGWYMGVHPWYEIREEIKLDEYCVKENQ